MRKGKTVTTPDVVIHTLERGDRAPGRYGLVVGKKDRGAVARNRAKRQLREAVRRAGGIYDGCDSVIVLRRGRSVDVDEVSRQIWKIMDGQRVREEAGDS
jgi:ribonuclease P protein component